MIPEVVQQKLDALPARPGCYVFRDRKGAVLYVGKAKSLRARVRSYFQEGTSDVRAFIPFLLRQIGDVETVLAGTEKEAAVLENSLIKEHRPRFNVKLRDDKEFLTLRLDREQPYPRLELVRRPKKDRSRYFGPYHSATSARRTLHVVEKHFQLRTCSDRELASRRRPCLQYQIKRCPGPCVYEIDGDHYGSQVRAVELFLDGRHDELTRDLEERMAAAAAELEYELAALYRDQLAAVRSIRERQRVVMVTDRDQDVLGLFREADQVEMAVMVVRQGRVVDVASYASKRVEVPDDEVVAAFIRDHYGDDGPGASWVPDEIIVPVLPEGADGVEAWLMDQREAAVGGARSRRQPRILVPARGERRQLLQLATDNARHAYEEKRRAEEDVEERLSRVQQKLRLPTVPRRVECVDISHLGGQDTVGAVVALEDARPDKKRYRSYRVKTTGDGDDYGAMFEVLSRRFSRGRAAADADAEAQAESGGAAAPAGQDWSLPDLFVVDGGRGQLAVALTAAADAGLHDLRIVGLAKEREKADGDKVVDRVYLPGQKNPIPLRPNTPELFILAMARDEAHRFANRARKKVGHQRRFTSELDAVPGVGPKTRAALLGQIGSVAALRRASDEELLAVKGVSRKTLAALRQHLGPPAGPAPATGADNAGVADEA